MNLPKATWFERNFRTFEVALDTTWYKPEDLIGKTVMIVENLNPVKLCGVESNGMILACDCPNDDVKVIFLDDSIPEGCKIR